MNTIQTLVRVVTTLTQLIIGLLILLNMADIRTIAWYYLGIGSVTFLPLVFIGIAQTIKEIK